MELFGCRALRKIAFFLAGLGFFLMARPSAEGNDMSGTSVLVDYSAIACSECAPTTNHDGQAEHNMCSRY